MRNARLQAGSVRAFGCLCTIPCQRIRHLCAAGECLDDAICVMYHIQLPRLDLLTLVDVHVESDRVSKLVVVGRESVISCGHEDGCRSSVDPYSAYGLFRPITLWPFPEKRVAALAKQAKAIVVPELNLGQMILEVERVAKGACDIVGINRVDGEPINPGQIIDQVKEVK